jgi:hypothetical protein
VTFAAVELSVVPTRFEVEGSTNPRDRSAMTDGLSPDLSDHDLLLGGLADAVAENRAGAQKWLRLLTYYRRRETDDPVHCAQAPHGTCFRPGCDAPATEAELDHRIAWPEGETTPENLWPGCKLDHKAKHAPGFCIGQTDNGSFTLETPAGFSHEISRTAHPSDDEWADPTGIQHSATELLEGLTYLKQQREDFEVRHWEHDWEYDLGDWEWELTSASWCGPDR